MSETQREVFEGGQVAAHRVTNKSLIEAGSAFAGGAFLGGMAFGLVGAVVSSLAGFSLTLFLLTRK